MTSQGSLSPISSVAHLQCHIGTDTISLAERAGVAVEHVEAKPVARTRSHQWNHSVGEIVTALIRSGLVIDEVAETKVSAWCRWPGLQEQCDEGWRLVDPAQREQLPLQLVVQAHSPR